ncbi:MAG: Uma2 family endonuclease [Gammaproteobacteria bacterium]|jgi:Uma2 family endonuclease|nr:Uma2 family endonuclease [Gammaproteobacteria bacterium]
MTEPNRQIRFRYEDYKSLPESTEKRYELLDGELLMVPAPTITHQRISRDLEARLHEYCQRTRIGEVLYSPVDVVLGEADAREVVQPDILLVASERLSIIAEEEIRGAPDLVVEILSAGTELRDRTYKKILYGRFRVREYWIVDPAERTIEVHGLTQTGLELQGSFTGGERVESTLLPYLELTADSIFPLTSRRSEGTP